MPNLKERKEKCQGDYLEEDNVPILEAEIMRTEDKTRQDVQLRKN